VPSCSSLLHLQTKELPDVPMLDEFVTKQQDRLVLDMIFRGKRWAVP
jgi:hypothetical protein